MMKACLGALLLGTLLMGNLQCGGAMAPPDPTVQEERLEKPAGPGGIRMQEYEQGTGRYR